MNFCTQCVQSKDINNNLIYILQKKNMIKYPNIKLLVIVLLICSANQIKAEQLQNIALINDVTFYNEQFNNSHAGNGFIINHNDNDYAISAKHILMIVKTDKMQFVDFSGELKQWKMYDKNNADRFLIVDELLNANKKERLDWQTLSNDWVVFSIKENHTGYTPLRIRQEPLVAGEQLTVVGWSYGDKNGPQRRYDYEFESTIDGLHKLKQIKGPQSLAGLSGSPVVDKNNRVVGVVSSGWQDEKTQITYIQASQSSDIFNFIKHYTNNVINPL